MEKLVIAIFVWFSFGLAGVSISIYHSIHLHGYWYTVAGDNVDEDIKIIYYRILAGLGAFGYAIYHYSTEKYAGKRVFGLFNIFNVRKLKQMHRDNVMR